MSDRNTGGVDSTSPERGNDTAPTTTTPTTTTAIEDLGDKLRDIKIHDDKDDLCCWNNILVCDAGYGFPREKVPRKEKVNAIASQLSNFLQWQLQKCRPQKKVLRQDDDEKSSSTTNLAMVEVVGCPDETIRRTLEKLLLEKLSISELPNHVKISCDSMEQFLFSVAAVIDNQSSFSKSPPVYLSPDAEESLDPTTVPPNVVIVGMLIDRRVQPNRSKNRASKLEIVAKRWSLEDCFIDISAKEPLNVDCVLEGMQQWWWNCDDATKVSKECFVHAASQAIVHHAERHPSRPLHLSDSSAS